MLAYREIRKVIIDVKNISMTVSVKVTIKENSHSPRILIDQILVNGLGSNINFGLENSGLFIREVQNLFNVSKEYIMLNIISLLEDFKEPM